MNRREFLKKCSLLPFIGGLAAMGQSWASESKLTEARKVKFILYYGKVGPDNIEIIVSPSAQMRKLLKEQGFPKEYII